MTLHFAYVYFLISGLIGLIIAIMVKYFLPQRIVYHHSLVHVYIKNKIVASAFQKHIFNFLRMFSLILMVILLGKPQLADRKTKTNIDGIDIMLALDVSGSMNLFDDLNDRRSRWTVVQKEAIRFVNKRDYDAIGLVIFGRYAVTRCPLTTDKNVLKDIISQLYIGSTSSDMANGTALFRGLVAAVRRLQTSQAKSKIIVLLTDGEPSEGDIAYQDAITIAQKIGVKIYTIGVGGEQGGFYEDPFYGVRSAGLKINTALLKKISEETGGLFFEAKNPQDVEQIYNKIDTLEKTEHEIQVYNTYYDAFLPLLWFVFFILFLENVLRTFIWFRL
jgi:Ca-activated chloride channel family protein